VNTTVTVTAGKKEELAEQQVQIAVQQRIGGFIPNFYSTYDWYAPNGSETEISTEYSFNH
jgi:hypothetical protein